MAAFFSQHFMLIIIVIGVAVFIVKLRSLLKKAHRIDDQGIETDALVSYVGKDLATDVSSSSYYTYVTYKDEHGTERESIMQMGSDPEFEEGEKLVVKFIPGEYDMVRFVRRRDK